jgi:hypothetical protein
MRKFKEFLKNIKEASLPYDPKIKLKDANWQGAAGSTGKVANFSPIMKHDKKRT